jgi:hypothetical protein
MSGRYRHLLCAPWKCLLQRRHARGLRAVPHVCLQTFGRDRLFLIDDTTMAGVYGERHRAELGTPDQLQNWMETMRGFGPASTETAGLAKAPATGTMNRPMLPDSSERGAEVGGGDPSPF